MFTHLCNSIAHAQVREWGPKENVQMRGASGPEPKIIDAKLHLALGFDSSVTSSLARYTAPGSHLGEGR